VVELRVSWRLVFGEESGCLVVCLDRGFNSAWHPELSVYACGLLTFHFDIDGVKQLERQQCFCGQDEVLFPGEPGGGDAGARADGAANQRPLASRGEPAAEAERLNRVPALPIAVHAILKGAPGSPRRSFQPNLDFFLSC